MEFKKYQAGVLVIVLCLVVIAAVIWFCLSGMSRKKTPDGVMVEYRQEYMVPTVKEVTL